MGDERDRGITMRHSLRARLLVVVTIAMLVAPACKASTAIGPAGSTTAPPAAIDVSTKGTIAVKVDADAARCDPIDPRHCLLPFPNDHFTVEDGSKATGRRVNLARESMPANAGGVRIDPTDWNRADGFSPGSEILAYLGPVDLAASRAAPITDIGASLRDDSPIVVLDAATRERVPQWAEMDSHAASDANRMLIIHPAVSLTEGHRYVVAMRGLRAAALPDGGAKPVVPSDAFRAYRDRLDSAQAPLENRRRHFEELFATLASAGVGRDDLQITWDFTVASPRDRTERVLRVRDGALAQIGDRSPAFTITGLRTDVDERTAKIIDGTFEMPNYLTGDGSAGNGFNLGPDGLPQPTGNKITMPFRCVVPRAAVTPGAPAARVSLYGHGLLGSESEVGAGNVRTMANEHNIVFCATRWIGMGQDDIAFVASVLADFSNFPKIPDRLQQGLVATTLLGRVMTRPDGFASRPEFQREGQPIIDTSALFYDGNSQGGVVGGAAVAINPDLRRAVLGVPGMNFSLLLPRSHDFVPFSAIFDVSYTDELERTLLIDVVQTLWDRGETNGYAQHITRDPMPGTPTKAVLLHVAYGDFQVAPVSADIEARTLGAKIHQPAVATGRSPDTTPYWGIDAIPSERYSGSAIVIWDSGSPTPPLTNSVPNKGRDPHEDPRNDAAARRQKSDFLRVDGFFTDVCNAQPCTAKPAD